MATKSKIIHGHSFTLTWPYEAGHTLTEAEAKALNQVRSENIGNNVREKVKEFLDAGDTAAAESLVAERDANYIFSFSSSGGARKIVDPVEREARAIARDVLKQHLAASGRKFKLTQEEGESDDDFAARQDAWDEKIEENLDMIASKQEVLKVAKKRVAEKEKTKQSISEGLSL